MQYSVSRVCGELAWDFASLHTSAKVTLRPSAASYGHSDMTNTALLSCRECLKDDPTPEKGESSLLDWVSVTTRWWLRVSWVATLRPT